MENYPFESWAWWHMPIIPTVEKMRSVATLCQEFKSTLDQIVRTVPQKYVHIHE